MLTGDNRNVSSLVAANCEIEEVVSDLMPVDKAYKIRELKGRGLTVAIVEMELMMPPHSLRRMWDLLWGYLEQKRPLRQPVLC